MTHRRKLLQSILLETSPVMAGYLVVGIAFGLFLNSSGYSFIWVIVMGLLIFSGSMQFVAITFLQGGVGWLQMIVISLAMNIRHMVYGLSFIDSFHRMGKKRHYMIYALTDETYSLLVTRGKKGIEDHQAMFLIALFNQAYWIIGGVIGSLIGNLITINTKGIEFAMTALFLVSLLDQLKQQHNRKPAVIGLLCSVASIVFFGKANIILPALLGMITLLLFWQKEDDTCC